MALYMQGSMTRAMLLISSVRLVQDLNTCIIAASYIVYVLFHFLCAQRVHNLRSAVSTECS